MLIRLGILTWWLGTLIIALVLLLTAYAAIDHWPCRALLASQAKAESEYAIAYEKFKRKNPSGTDLSFAMADEGKSTASVGDPEKIEACKRYDDLFAPLFWGSLLTLILWSFAFVLGGSFWTPPKVRVNTTGR